MGYEVTSGYTKRALSDSLKRYMETKPFSKITVNDIITDCRLNRKTFYYHFTDTRDLLKWTLEQDAIEALRKFDLMIDHRDAILFILEYLEKNQVILNCAYDSVGRDELKRFLYKDFYDIGSRIVAIAEKQVGAELSGERRKLVVIFYTEGIAGLIVDWLQGDIKCGKEAVVDHIVSIFRDGLTGIVSAASSGNDSV